MVCTESTPPLTPDILLLAYRRGIFPMADDSGKVEWHAPDPRAIFPLTPRQGPVVAPNKRMARYMRNSGFTTTFDQAFEEVVGACATVHGPTWLSDRLIAAYVELHRMGHAHSVETWKEGRLVGGLYGVALGGAFFGESMFSTAPNAGKNAFYKLVERLREQRFILFDTQFANAHTRSLGAVEIPREHFLQLLDEALALQPRLVRGSAAE